MNDRQVGAAVRALVQGAVSTRMHVDVLHALHAAPAAQPLARVAAAVGDPGAAVVRRCVAELAQAGLVRWTDDDALAPAALDAERRHAVEQLLALRRERPARLDRELLRRLARPRSRAAAVEHAP